MNNKIQKIGFGGSCHWCTEAIFLSLKGVSEVKQGWIASVDMDSGFSEGVIVYFNPKVIDLKTLIAVHLNTHNSTKNHSMRHKYRSAVYVFDQGQSSVSKSILQELQSGFDETLITQILPYQYFKPSLELIQNYYYKNPQKPFCETYIDPKLKLLLDRFAQHVDAEKVGHLS